MLLLIALTHAQQTSLCVFHMKRLVAKLVRFVSPTDSTALNVHARYNSVDFRACIAVLLLRAEIQEVATGIRRNVFEQFENHITLNS